MKPLLLLLLCLPVSLRAVTQAEFTSVVAVFEEEFQRDAAQHGRRFEIMHDWNQDWAQAFARRWETDHLVVYGGVARLPGASVDSFALVLCHEVGHLYGGAPFSDAYNMISVEGQADYWAGEECWERVAAHLPTNGAVSARFRSAALTLTSYFASSRGLPAPQLSTPDPSVATVTNLTHPTPQCRLDTFLAGLNEAPRPRCWFAP